eukprot:722851-Rhodomonas_salina.1
MSSVSTPSMFVAFLRWVFAPVSRLSSSGRFLGVFSLAPSFCDNTVDLIDSSLPDATDFMLGGGS